MLKQAASLGCVVAALFGAASSAKADVHEGDLRLSIDTSLATFGWVDGEGDKVFYTGVGPSALGGDFVLALPTSLVGVGLGYSLTDQIALGMRAGFGYTHLTDDDESFNVWSVDLEPELRFMPAPASDSVFFISVAPLLSVAGTWDDESDMHQTLFGGSLALGQSFFLAEAVSLDLSLAAQFRTGELTASYDGEDELESEQDISDMRGIVRIGLSHWR